MGLTDYLLGPRRVYAWVILGAGLVFLFVLGLVFSGAVHV